MFVCLLLPLFTVLELYFFTPKNNARCIPAAGLGVFVARRLCFDNMRRGPTRAATGWPDRQVEAPRKELPADFGPEPPGQREPTDQGTDRLNGPARRPDPLKDGLDIPATDAD